MKIIKTIVILFTVALLSACGSKGSSIMDVYTSCKVGDKVTITVTQGTFGSSASMSCTYTKEG